MTETLAPIPQFLLDPPTLRPIALRTSAAGGAFWQVSVTDPHTDQRGTFFGRDFALTVRRARAWLDVRRAMALCEALDEQAAEDEAEVRAELDALLDTFTNPEAPEVAAHLMNNEQAGKILPGLQVIEGNTLGENAHAAPAEKPQPVEAVHANGGRTVDTFTSEDNAKALAVATRDRKRWTDEEVRYLVKNYPAKGCAPVALTLSRSVFGVLCKAAKLGLSRDPAPIGGAA